MLLRRKLAGGAIVLLLALAFTTFRPPPATGPVERDFEAYYAAGATVNAGGDPYSRAIWNAEKRIPGVDVGRDELLPFVGPAAGLPLWALLARLPYAGAVFVWTVVLALSAVVALGAALRIAGAPRDPWLYGFAAVTGGTAAPLIGSLALGQTALVSAAAIAAAMVAYRLRSPVAATFATLFAAFQPNLAVVLVARLRSGWDLGAAAAAAAGFTALTFGAGGGPAGLRAYLGVLAAHGRAERDIAIQHTPAAIAYAFGAAPGTARLVGAAIAAGTVLAAVAVARRERLDATTATLFACALLPLAIPFFHEQDFIIVLVPALVLAVRARGTSRAFACVGAVLALVDWFGFAQRPAAAGQLMCLGLALVGGLMGMAPAGPRRPRDFAAAATFILLAAIALPLGRAHTAPTWPEMLPGHYRASRAASESDVWGDEQRTAGLARKEPVWGLLRCIPLAGGALLGCAIVADARRRRRAAASARERRIAAEATLPVAAF